MGETRTEKDSMGEVHVPKDALYAAQTQRAVDNFPISGRTMPKAFIQALGVVKKAAARANLTLGLLDETKVNLIQQACDEVISGALMSHFPVDIFQTGSGTSSNMNANEVIANRANQLAKDKSSSVLVHPNDDVNYGQSSNDVVPTALRIAAVGQVYERLLPSLKLLQQDLSSKGIEYKDVVKTGRTHLMDAMPVTFKQVFDGYAYQIKSGEERILSALSRMSELPQGGTAVGTGINTHPKFASLFAQEVSKQTGLSFSEANNHFEAQASVDAPVELSGQLKSLACSLLKIANDFRWMNSGPNAGLAEIQLAALQPGSSIMPGKVNPVIEESVAMVAAQVIGNDASITIAGQSGNFELNVMLPLVASNLIDSINYLANASENFAKRSVRLVKVNQDSCEEKVGLNPILVTALNPIIGYEKGAAIAKKAFAENRPLFDVAKEMTDLSDKELSDALDPIKLTQGGITTS